MTRLAEQVLAAIRRHHLLEPEERVLVAVSGGCDSVVLLHLLHELSATERWRLEVAHFNHRLRGPEADADAAWVNALAAGLSLPCHAGRGDTRAVAVDRGMSLEMAARDLRHRFLARTAVERGITKVAVGHHGDDQVETFFLRLLRGTSGDGAAGMRWTAPSPADRAIRLVRPLLGCSREALRQAALSAGWTWREDATNAAPDALRNRIRQELIPWLLADYQPALREVIRRFMEVTGAEAQFVAKEAGAWLEGVRPEEFQELPVAVQRQVLLRQLHRLGIAAEFALVDRLLNEAGAKVEVSPQRRVWRAGSGLLCEDTVAECGFQGGRCTVELCEPTGGVEFDGMRLRWEFSASPGGDFRVADRSLGEEWFDADVPGRRVVLRHWQPGDRFQPIGLPLPAKVQDLFVNAGVPRSERRCRVVAETEKGTLFWVEGLRIGEVAKVRTTSRRLLRWVWTREAAT